jgi:hypothetical protein
MFVGRFIKGILLGWIMSLIFYLAKRILAQIFNSRPMSRSDDAPNPVSQKDIVETIWAGMSRDQLHTSFGMPQSKENTQGGEVWVYANLNGQGTETSIVIEAGLVKSWKNTTIQNQAISS